VCLFCKGCIDIYDGFSVGGQEIQNCSKSSSKFQVIDNECIESCKNDYHAYDSKEECNSMKDKYYIHKNDSDQRECKKGPHADSYTYDDLNSCKEAIEGTIIKDNASSICNIYDYHNKNLSDTIPWSPSYVNCSETEGWQFYFQKGKHYTPQFVNCSNTNKDITEKNKVKIQDNFISQTDYKNDKLNNSSNTDVIQDLWYCDWESKCCRYDVEKGRLSLDECNTQCIGDPNPNYSVPLNKNSRNNDINANYITYDILKNANKLPSILEEYQSIKNNNSVDINISKNLILSSKNCSSSNNRNNKLRKIYDNYPDKRLFIFNNYTSDSIIIIMTLPNFDAFTNDNYLMNKTDSYENYEKFKTDLKKLVELKGNFQNLYSKKVPIILDSAVGIINQLVVGVIKPNSNYKLVMPLFPELVPINSSNTMKSALPSVNLSFVKNNVDYIVNDYLQLKINASGQYVPDPMKTNIFTNLSGGTRVELTLNNSKYNNELDRDNVGVINKNIEKIKGLPTIMTDLHDFYDMSIIPAGSVGAHMNASTTAYTGDASGNDTDIDLTSKTYKSEYNLKCINEYVPKKFFSNFNANQVKDSTGVPLEPSDYCNINGATQTRWCEPNWCNNKSDYSIDTKPGKGFLPDEGNIFGSQSTKEVFNSNSNIEPPSGEKTHIKVYGCGIPYKYKSVDYYNRFTKDTEPECREFYDGNKGGNLTNREWATKCNRWSTDTIKEAYKTGFRCGVFIGADNLNIDKINNTKAEFIGPNYNLKIEPFNDSCVSPKIYIPYHENSNLLKTRIKWDMSKLIDGNNYKDINTYVYPYQDELGLSNFGQATADCRVNLFKTDTSYKVYDLLDIVSNASNISINNTTNQYEINSDIKKDFTDPIPVFIMSIDNIGFKENKQFNVENFVELNASYINYLNDKNVNSYLGYDSEKNCSLTPYEDFKEVKYPYSKESFINCSQSKDSSYCDIEEYQIKKGPYGKQITDGLSGKGPFLTSDNNNPSAFINTPCKELYSCSGSDPILLKPDDKKKLCQSDNQHDCILEHNCSWINESYYYNTSGTCYIDYTKYMDTTTSDLCGKYYNASLTGWDNTVMSYEKFKKYINPKIITTREEADIVNENSRPDKYGAFGGAFSNLVEFYNTIRVNCPESGGKQQLCQIYVDGKQVDDPKCSVTNESCLNNNIILPK